MLCCRKGLTTFRSEAHAMIMMETLTEVSACMQVLEAVAGHRGLTNKYAVAETIFRVTERLFFADAAA
jgi:hypothetical protein